MSKSVERRLEFQIATIQAEVTRLEELANNQAREIGRLENERPAIRRIIIDPTGYVALEFDTFDDRADFCHWIPPGMVYGDTRHNTGAPPWRLTWKLADFEMPFMLELTEERKKVRDALGEANHK